MGFIMRHVSHTSLGIEPWTEGFEVDEARLFFSNSWNEVKEIETLESQMRPRSVSRRSLCDDRIFKECCTALRVRR